jgi:hypothetical protein
MADPATFKTLRQFRAGVYRCFEARRDALFELLDAATVAGLVPSLAYLSLPAAAQTSSSTCATWDEAGRAQRAAARAHRRQLAAAAVVPVPRLVGRPKDPGAAYPPRTPVPTPQPET